MKILVISLMLAMFLWAAFYALNARSIRDDVLRRSAESAGTDSRIHRLNRWLMDNESYVVSFRIGAAATAVLLLVAIIYFVRLNF